MKATFSLLAAILLGLLLAGCATSDELNNLRIGMTKDQVIGMLGKPDSTSAQANVEYLTYYLYVQTPTGPDRDNPYMVRLVDGKVESFGRFLQLYDLYNRPITNASPGTPEFPTAAPLLGTPGPVVIPPPAASNGTDIASELQKLKTLRDEGVLTEAEFETAKARVLAGQK
jgi:hypothetical protein